MEIFVSIFINIITYKKTGAQLNNLSSVKNTSIEN